LGALTIKGAIDGWKVMGCTFDGHGDEFDIELGQYDKYWYIGRQPTKNGEIIDSGAIDGKPLKVLVWNAEIPKVVRSNVKIVKIPGLLWFPYFCFCYLRDKLRKDR
jgi:hypothetical protein